MARVSQLLAKNWDWVIADILIFSTWYSMASCDLGLACVGNAAIFLLAGAIGHVLFVIACFRYTNKNRLWLFLPILIPWILFIVGLLTRL